MDQRQLLFMLLQSCLLFTAARGLTTRQVYDVLSDKIQGLAFDVALLREDVGTFKQKHQTIAEKPGNIDGDPSNRNIEKLQLPNDITGDENVKGIEALMLNFERKLKNAFMHEKAYLREQNEDIQSDAENHRERVGEVLDRIEEKLNAEIGALKDLVDKEITDYKQEQDRLEEQIYVDIESAKQKIKELEDEPIRKILNGLPWWADWSSWTSCYNNCTGGGRMQSRSRTVVKTGNQATPATEAETRPCNAVQFAGCIKSYGSTDNFGVTYDFADQLAQATCTAMVSGGYVNAVRRQCTSSAPTCAVICSSVGRRCFNQLHVYRGSPVLLRGDVAKKGLQMYKYNSCGGNFCGPNFCCCQS